MKALLRNKATPTRFFHTSHNNKVSLKTLFNQNSKQAISSFFQSPNTFDATFLIGRREVSFGEAFKIYKTVETKKSIQVIAEMILSCHRNNEQEMCEKLLKDTFLPLLSSYSTQEYKALKEYSWNRIFACLLVLKNNSLLVSFYSTLTTNCPHITLNEGNQRHLLNIFSSAGEADFALKVLESIKNPTLIDYTMAIRSLGANSRMDEAIQLLKKMENCGIESDTVVFISLLKSCIDNSLHQEGLHLIDMVKERNIVSAVLNTTIINFYFHFGNIQSGLKFFNGLDTNDSITYGCAIQGLAKNGNIGQSIRLLESMIEKKLNPDHITFTYLIKKCEENKLVTEGKFLHNLIRKKRIEHVSIYNSLLNFYARCGDIQTTLDIFEQMTSRNETTWNSVLQSLSSLGRIDEAFSFYNRMKGLQLCPDVITFVILFKCCANASHQLYGEELHRDCIKYGLSNNKQIMTSLVVFYSKCGNEKKSLEIFEEIKSCTNIVAWNAVFQLLIAQKKVDEALKMLKELKDYQLEPDAIFYSTLLRACADNSRFQEGLTIHKEIEKKNINDEILQLSLLYFYGKKGDVETCRNVFSRMKEKNMLNLSVYTSIISSLILNKEIDDAFSTFEEMRRIIQPDNILLSMMLKACAEHNRHLEGKSLHKFVIDCGCEIDTTLATALVYFYCKNDKEMALQLFNKFKNSGKSNTFMWNSITQLLLSDGRLNEAIQHLYQYSKFGVEPDNVTFTTILQSCTEKHDLVKGKTIHDYIKQNNFEGDVILDRNLINFYSKCGELEMAKSIFHSAIEKKQVNSFIFNAMLFAYAEHGKANDCFQVFSDMIGASIEPTPETFTALLTACSHCNMHSKALSIYNSMKEVFNIKPSDIHTSCLVDALARSGHLQEALNVIGESKEKVIWVTLLGACRKHNNIPIAEKAFDVLVNIDPTDGSFYVLLYNIYIFNRELQKANHIRELMKLNNATKTVGMTSVYIGEEIHTFTSDDKKHVDNHLIQKELDKLILELIEAGYKPDTRWVTRIESLTEDEKRKLLCRHSEKLAMAYAFVRMPGTSKITLFKNLRVCGDCHEATKFISKVRKCVIVVRDASRYHHFENGKCSCGDNW